MCELKVKKISGQLFDKNWTKMRCLFAAVMKIEGNMFAVRTGLSEK